MRFEDLQLNPTLLAAVAAEGYSTPTTIQQKAIPHVLAGQDLVGLAQTGTGKTAAFALPILHRLMLHPIAGMKHIRVLVLAPTRELASQIAASFATYGHGAGQRETVIFGGVGQEKQTRALKEGIDILVATPGRLLDLMQQGFVDFKHLEVLVLDEADRMLDMGFINDVRKIVKHVPVKRQTLLFSATMPKDVKELADSLLKNPARVEAHAVSSTAERIDQSVYFVERGQKRSLLQHLLREPAVRRALVFTRTKQGANRVAEFLSRVNIPSEAIHGNKSQGARERALAHFVSGETPVLVATDIAARGIDIDDISHVINFDLPNIPESYVHRIGRTARAGATGIALSFCDTEEREYLRDIEKLIGKPVPRATMPGSLPEAPPDVRLPHTTSRPHHAPRPQAPRPPQPRSPKEARQRAQGKARGFPRQAPTEGALGGRPSHGHAAPAHQARPAHAAATPRPAASHAPSHAPSHHAAAPAPASNALRPEMQARPGASRGGSWRRGR